MKFKNHLMFFLMILIFPTGFSHANNSYEESYGWTTRFYTEGSYQEDRNYCLGIAIAEDAYPGIDQNYTVSRGNKSENKVEKDLLVNYFFDVADAIASINVNYPSWSGKPKSTVHLFVVIDFCLPDLNYEVAYDIWKGDSFESEGEHVRGYDVEFQKVNNDCLPESSDSCADMDLSDFFAWADKTKEEWGWYDEDSDNDDDDTAGSADDDDDDDEGCGCMVTYNSGSISTFALMFFVGFLFLLIRKKKPRKIAD